MIQTISYKRIPNTTLEIGSAGEHSSRLISIKTIGETEPIHISTAPRAILIGNPQREIRQAMRDGHFTRVILESIDMKVGGKTFTALQKALDTYLKNL